jgi:SHOCT-like domain
MNPERMRILELLEQGKITAAEAAELLRAIDEDVPPGDERRERRRGRDRDREEENRPKWFRVRVTETATGRARANVAIPYGMVRFGIGFAPGHFSFRKRGMPRQVDDLLEALRSGRRGTIFDVTDNHDGDRIEIIVE